jgi:hypothetical protein
VLGWLAAARQIRFSISAASSWVWLGWPNHLLLSRARLHCFFGLVIECVRLYYFGFVEVNHSRDATGFGVLEQRFSVIDDAAAPAIAAQVSYLCPLSWRASAGSERRTRSCLKCFLLWWFMGSVWLVWLIGVSTHVHDRHIMFDSRYNKLNRNGKTYLTIHSCGPWYWIEIIIVA